MYCALPLLILGGFAGTLERTSRRSRGVALSLVWLAASSLHVYPHGVSYFNEWVGGPAQGWKYLADSNLDWADLPDLGPTWSAIEFPVNLHLRVRQPVPLPQARQHGPADAAFTGDSSSALPPATGPLCDQYEFSGGLPRPDGYENYLEYFRRRVPDAHADIRF
jgi:hypothetical protein